MGLCEALLFRRPISLFPSKRIAIHSTYRARAHCALAALSDSFAEIREVSLGCPCHPSPSSGSRHRSASIIVRQAGKCKHINYLELSH